jgi:hypothetical protein
MVTNVAPCVKWTRDKEHLDAEAARKAKKGLLTGDLHRARRQQTTGVQCRDMEN